MADSQAVISVIRTLILASACLLGLNVTAQTLISFNGTLPATANTMSAGSQSNKASAFTVGANDVSVTAVDFYTNTSGSTVNFTVSLWEATYAGPNVGQQTLEGNVLASQTVTASAQSILTLNTATFANPVSLISNQTYMIVINYAPVTGTSALLGTATLADLTGTGVTPLTGLFRDATGTAGVLDGSVTGTAVIAYNLQGTAVPEPSTWALLSGALLLGAFVQRRRAAP